MNPTMLTEPARAVPVIARPDVLVVGGGAAGLGAAAAAAGAGADTLLIERYGFLGGTLAAVTLGSFCGQFAVLPDRRLLPVVGGLYDELLERLARLDAAAPPLHWIKVATTPYDPVTLRLVADQMLADAGVNTLLHTLAVEVIRDGDRIAAVIVESKAGRGAIVPSVVIDCSGDADVAARAGAGFEVGEHGATQFPSSMFRMANVDRAAFEGLDRQAVHGLLEQAVADGIPLPRTGAALVPSPIDGFVHVNATKIGQPDGRPFDLLDPWQLTMAEQEGRRQAFLYADTARRYLPGFTRARIADLGCQLGIRETRRVRGDRQLSDDDVTACRKDDDGIACSAWPMELHDTGRKATWIWLPDGDWYTIALGCLIAERLSNLLIAGRNLSASHGAQASARVAAPAMALGQAAGITASLALAHGGAVRQVAVGAVRQNLLRAGAVLAPDPTGRGRPLIDPESSRTSNG
jgi:hypothetical protein